MRTEDSGVGTAMGAIEGTGVRDQSPDAVFDRLTAMVAAMCGAPVVMFTIRDDQLTSFRGAIGLPEAIESGPAVPMQDSMCQFVITDGVEMIVPDVRNDPALGCLPPAHLLGAGSYAGFPVHDPDGSTLGSLCVIDYDVRDWTPAELDMFRSVALAASSEVALRTALRTSEIAARQAEEASRRAEEHAKEASDLARVLQEALLPTATPRIPGLELATRYRAGADGTKVLGDFYDVFPVPSGWGVVVGDVCGKGIQAARTTALARSTVRAVGHAEDDPEVVLTTLNEVLHVWFGDQRSFATAVYATLHQGAHGVEVTVASAGHPAGFVVCCDGRVQRLHDGGRVLGIYAESDVAVEKVRLGPGDGLVLFTDGITEARRHGNPEQFDEDGVDRTLRALSPGTSADGIATAVSNAALAHAGGEVSDDTAVLVLRKPPEQR